MIYLPIIYLKWTNYSNDPIYRKSPFPNNPYQQNNPYIFKCNKPIFLQSNGLWLVPGSRLLGEQNATVALLCYFNLTNLILYDI